MNELSDLTACVVDFGLFFGVAEKLAEKFKRVLYHKPDAIEGFPTINKCLTGDGFEQVEMCEDFWKVKKEIDLFVFPDIQNSGLQLELEAQGFPVWGSRAADSIETDREKFTKLLKQVGLEVPPHRVIVGLTNLRLFLMENEGPFFVKISKYRGCFDEETEILTDGGWKFFKDVSKSDRVATMDVETRDMEYRLPSAYIKYWYDGPMVKIKGRKINASVTPNHCFWSKSGLTMKEWKYRPIFELMQRSMFHIPQAFRWKGEEISEYVIPNGYSEKFSTRHFAGPRSIKADLWLDFLGWFVSEGSLNLAGKGQSKRKITVSQSQQANLAKHTQIKVCMDSMGYNVQTECKAGFSIYNHSLYEELAKMCYTEDVCDCGKRHCSHRKMVPPFIKKLSPRQIKIFLRSYGLGDGCKDGKSYRYYTSSKKLADDIQELLFLSGGGGVVSSKIPKNHPKIKGRVIHSLRRQYCVSELFRRDIQIAKRNLSVGEHSGFVYDVTVGPHHSIFVRRHGEAFWSGNSLETKKFRDFDQDEGLLDQWAVKFGPAKEKVRFIVCDPIDTDLEIGGDTFCIDGRFPDTMLHGDEWKDAGYLATVTKREDMPEQVQQVLEAFSPVLAEHRYRNALSMELRVLDDKFYYIDPCHRFSLPATASRLELMTNFAEVVWHGANGELLEPEWEAQFAAEAVLTMKGDKNAWAVADFPKEVRPWAKFSNCCEIDGRVCWPPDDGNFVIGWLCAIGDSIEETLDALHGLADKLPDGVDCDTDALVGLLQEIHTGEEQGIEFGEDEVPAPETALNI